MITINKTIKLEKGEISISRNKNEMEIKYVDCKKNASTTNRIIIELLPLFDQLFGYNSKLKFDSFEEAIGDVEYALNIQQTLLNLKLENCRYGSKLIEKLKEQLKKIPSHLESMISDIKNGFSYAEKLVLGKIGNVGFSEFSEYELNKYYNAKTLKLSPKLDAFAKEVNSFDYRKYGHKTSEITKNLNDLITEFKKSINDFEKLVAEVGDDIINWGSHKLTRRGVDDYTVRQFIDDYQEGLREKGVMPIEKSKNDSVQKSRDNPNKTQEDYFRLFKSGTKDEAKAVVQSLNLENLKILLTNPIKSIKDRVRENRDSIITTFCNLDDGSNWFLLISQESSVPLTYLFKVDNRRGTECPDNFILTSLKRLSNLDVPMPDSFYDNNIRPLDLEKSLSISDYVTNEVLKRKTNEEIVFIVKLLSGLDGNLLCIGLEVPAKERLYRNVADVSLQNLPIEIYPEIKDNILDLKSDARCFAHMIIAHNDKAMATSMLEEIGHNKEELIQLINHFYSYDEKINLVQDNFERTYTLGFIHEIFSLEEKPRVFKHFLENGALSVTSELFEERWGLSEEVRKEHKALVKEYLSILSQTKSPNFPLLSELPKDIRKNLLTNGAVQEVESDVDRGGVVDFTRKEIEECLKTKTDEEVTRFLKEYRPELLTQKELQA